MEQLIYLFAFIALAILSMLLGQQIFRKFFSKKEPEQLFERGSDFGKISPELTMLLKSKNFGAIKHGAITYILKNGQRVTGGHHSYGIRDGKIIGKLGATIEEVGQILGKNLTLNSSRTNGCKSREIKSELELSNVLKVIGSKKYEYSKQGAIVYIVNIETDVIMTGGYHHYKIAPNGKSIIGILGGSTEVAWSKKDGFTTEGGIAGIEIKKQKRYREIEKELGSGYIIRGNGFVYLEKDGLTITKEFHDFVIDNGIIYGMLGAVPSKIDL